MFNWSAKCSYFSFECMWATYGETGRNSISLCALVHHGWQQTLYRKTCNIFNLLALLLFFNMFLFVYSVFSTYSMFLVRKGHRDICSQQLIELVCTWSIGFQLVAAIQHRNFQPVPLSDLYILVMVYPFYVDYDLPSCCVLLLSWFGNKLSIQYILNLSCANCPYFWSLFFVYLCQIILMHAPYCSTHMSSLIRIQW